MMHKIIFIFLSSIIGLADNIANANDNVYSKMNISIGYDLKKYVDDVKMKGVELATLYKTTKLHHSALVSAGYNLYFKASKYFHPFVGVEATARISSSNREITKIHDEKWSIFNLERTAMIYEDVPEETCEVIYDSGDIIYKDNYGNEIARESKSAIINNVMQYVENADRFESGGSSFGNEHNETTIFGWIHYKDGSRSDLTNITVSPRVLVQPRVQELTHAIDITDVSIKAHEYFVLNAKLGGRIVFNKTFSLSPYATVGFNVLQTKVNAIYRTQRFHNTAIDIGLSVGVGLETLINERFAVGLEYRKVFNNVKINDEKIKIYSNNAMIKIGYYFF